VSCCETDFQPEQIHLSIATPSSMLVMWITQNQLVSPAVAFWNTDESTTNGTISVRSVPATISTYDQSSWNGLIYTANLTNLSNGSVYGYQITGQTPDGPVSVAPSYFYVGAGSSSEPLVDRNLLELDLVPFVPGETASIIAIFGDAGTGGNAEETAEGLGALATNSSVQVVIHVGDIAYADGDDSVWDDYFRMIDSYSSQVPLMTAAGNHEDYNSFDAYYSRFQMPVSESDSEDRQYYSFNYEKIHFVVWSVEETNGTDLLPGGPQRIWLENDLAQANLERDVRPWVVLYGHRPMYCSSDSKDCSERAPEWRGLIEDLVNDYHVDLIIGAHKHNYERSYPVYQTIPTAYDYENPNAPVYFVTGVGGRDKNSDFDSPPDWNAHQDDKYGYLLISAADEYSMQMSYISKSFKVHDDATITRTSIPSEWTFFH